METNQNLEWIAPLYEAFNTGDLEAVFGRIAEDADWVIIGDRAEIPVSGTAKGHGEIQDLFFRVFEHIEISGNYPHHIYGQGKHITVHGSLTSTARATKKEIQSPFVDLLEVEDGKIIRYTRFLDTLAFHQALQG